ncbi:hypothetical protein DRP07_06840 [Archaeoglobales archaeon]|nr:MAG: hypothetical protein DRP07_06840 [Archaeoglobales archaeon]
MSKDFIRKIDSLQRELEYLKRELIHLKEQPRSKPSLFGSVRGEDVTEEMIEQAKKSLFRGLEEIY